VALVVALAAGAPAVVDLVAVPLVAAVSAAAAPVATGKQSVSSICIPK
jgi:hypothetical protein